MKNWEEMKDFSYVGIKLTKAHSISEGLKRCQIQKLTRNNSVYEHLKLHQKYKKMKYCQICRRQQSQKKQKAKFYSLTEPFMKSYATSFKGIIRKSQSNDKLNEVQLVKKFSLSESKINKGKKEVQNFTKQVQSLTNDLRKTKSTYFKMDSDRLKLQKKFQLDMESFQTGLQQEVGLTHNQLTLINSICRQSVQKRMIKMKKDQVKIKQLNKSIKFPFTERQMQKIIIQSEKAKLGIQSKQNKIIRSLYDYKSSANYSNRMKTIKKIIKE